MTLIRWLARSLVGDDSFGPAVGGFFDLTLRFQDTVFAMPLALWIILATPAYITRAIRKKPCTDSGLLLRGKATVVTAVIVFELVSLILNVTNESLQSVVSTAAAILSFGASIAIAIVLYVEHMYSLKTSTFLSIYLAMAALFDIVRARSYFIRPDLGAIGGISVALVILKLVLVALEEVSKARLIKSEYLRKPLGKEFISGFWNRSLFIWLNSTLIMGFKKDITINELPDPGPEFDSEHLHERFEPNWEKGNNSSKFKLALAGAQTLCWEFVSVFIPRACCIGFRMAQPFLVWRIIVAVGDRDTSVSTIGGLLGATFIVYAGIALTNVYYEHLNCRMTTFVRAILITAIFRKSLKLPYDDLKNASALTLMSTDVSGVERLFPLFHDTWSGLAELGIGLYILSTTVGAAAFLTLIPIFIMTVISSYAAKKMGVARAGWNEKIENRIAATSNILAQLKSLKMTGLTTLATKSLQKKRFEEIGYSSKERWLRAVLHMLQAVAEGMTPVVVLAGGFFWTRSSTGLGAADIFKTLSVIAIVSGPLSRVLVCMPFLVGSMACLGRIQKYLLLEDLVDTRIIDHDNDATLDTVIKEKPVGGVWAKSKCAMELEAATLSVPSIDRPLIKNAHMKDRRRGNVTMIYGPVGCGKSTLLKAIIGEVGLQSGRVRLGSGQVAYCDQTPWLQNCSIRDNIIAQTEYIADRYNDVLHCCALDEDMKQFSDGDKTIIGSRGSTLSGGQKQRVALARAIYACAPLLVLDDAISALDLATAKAILTRVFRKNSTVRMFDTSVVMTTNILEHLPLADVVFSINQTGELQQEPNVKNFVRDTAAQLAGQPEDNVPRTGENRKSEPVSELPSADVPEASELDNYNWVRRKGDMSLYTYYLKEMGWSRVALWVFLTAVTGAGEKIPQIFLRIWYDTNPTNYAYFGGFAALSAAYVLLTVVMVLYYYLVLAPAASNGLHSNLLKTVKGSTFSFICETDIGSILSRFSQDMTLVAQMLPISLLEVVFILCIALVSLGIISAGSSYAAAIIPIFAIVLYFVQYFYLRTSRQMRLLELEANALLFTLFSETSDGMQHIRAFQWQSNYMWQCHGMLDYSQKPYYYMFCIQRWLTLVLELSTCFIAVALVSLALFFTNSTSETAIGLAMINLITFSQLLNDLIAAWVELEASLGAIARTRDFNRTTPQEKPVDRLPKAKLPDYWPTEGGIEFANVNARYRSTGERSQQILNEINFKVQPGQKIAVTGRTGSGKSSLILSLLNLMVHSGTIAIDGTDIKTVDKDFLRSRITTVPQDGIELAASVRVNLDPYDDPKLTHRLFDDTLEDILARVGLQDIIKARGGLDASLKSMALSPGQKQLLCLARAILVREYTRSRIVLIDEATSNVDLETEKRLQSIMAKEFANCTVITVTHRDDGVEFADIVVEMADGRIIKTVDRRAKKDSQTKDFEDGGNAVAKSEMHNIEAQNKSEP